MRAFSAGTDWIRHSITLDYSCNFPPAPSQPWDMVVMMAEFSARKQFEKSACLADQRCAGNCADGRSRHVFFQLQSNRCFRNIRGNYQRPAGYASESGFGRVGDEWALVEFRGRPQSVAPRPIRPVQCPVSRQRARRAREQELRIAVRPATTIGRIPSENPITLAASDSSYCDLGTEGRTSWARQSQLRR